MRLIILNFRGTVSVPFLKSPIYRLTSEGEENASSINWLSFDGWGWPPIKAENSGDSS